MNINEMGQMNIEALQADNRRHLQRIAELEVERDQYKDAAGKWELFSNLDLYQELKKADQINGSQQKEIQSLLAKVKSLQEQEPIAYCRRDDFENRDDFIATTKPHELYTVKLYAFPVPEQADDYTLECLGLAQGARDHYAKENEQLKAQLDASQQSPAVAVPDENAWIIERLSYHKLERQDMSIDDCLKYLSTEWKEVCGRTTRQLVMQILELLAATTSPRITEQDAREIISDYLQWKDGEGNPRKATITKWLYEEFEGRALLDKLNGVKSE